jgi:hypothetical protein
MLHRELGNGVTLAHEQRVVGNIQGLRLLTEEVGQSLPQTLRALNRDDR